MRIAGKARYQALSRDDIAAADSLHGKEGVDGSSPSEGLQNPRSRGFFVQDDLPLVARAVGMEPFMELPRTRLDLVGRWDEVSASDFREPSVRNRSVIAYAP